MFFLDSGPSLDRSLHPSSSNLNTDNSVDAPAWIDSDDDRLKISLTSNNRLRKLRINEDEDLINGREYIRRLKRQYERLFPIPPWAQEALKVPRTQRRSSVGSDSSTSSQDENMQLSSQPLADILHNTNNLINPPGAIKRAKLRPEILDIQQTRPIPSVHSEAILSLSFHSKWPLLLSSGLASTLFLNHINPTAHPTPNPLLTSVHVSRTPIYTSHFLYSNGGSKIIFSGRRKYFHIWDLDSGNIEKVTRVYGHRNEQRSMELIKSSPCGRYLALRGTSKKGGGIINILDANTTQWITSMRIEGTQGVADFAWWRDGEGLTVVSKGSEVAEWSVSKRSYVARWNDEGFAPTVLTLGGFGGPKVLGGDRWVVIGSQSGIVNIYDRRSFVTPSNPEVITISGCPKPSKSFDQLTKSISHLVISQDGQILSFSSQWKKDALRLVHLPSCKVYRNWPTTRTPLGRITAVAFSSESNLLAIGNDVGKIHMWEIRS